MRYHTTGKITPKEASASYNPGGTLKKTLLCLFGLFALVGSPLLLPAQTQVPANAGRGIVAFPDKTWGIQMELSGFTVTSNEAKEDGRRYFLAENRQTGVTVSATLEKTAPGTSGMGCKEIMESRVADTPQNREMHAATGIEQKNVRIWQSEEKTFMDYIIPIMTGPGGMKVPINQQNRFLCFVHDGVFVDVHVSKADFHPGDEKLLDLEVNSVQVRDSPSRTSLDYFRAGSSYFISNDYEKAIPPYAQALASEQKQRTLDKKYWYVLVDNLGMAYGITGDLENARKTFEYGMKTDPDYPLFYFEMADYYGEKGDAQNAMVCLKKAHQRKANLLAGEKFPDPRDDDSFKNLMKNKEFRDFVDNLMKDI
jgi:hypothetical protein